MVGQGKEPGLRARQSRAGTASGRFSDGQDSGADQTIEHAPAEVGQAASRTGLSDHTRNRLAAQLRAMYDSITQQPVPDRFADLIAKLDSGDRDKL